MRKIRDIFVSIKLINLVSLWIQGNINVQIYHKHSICLFKSMIKVRETIILTIYYSIYTILFIILYCINKINVSKENSFIYKKSFTVLLILLIFELFNWDVRILSYNSTTIIFFKFNNFLKSSNYLQLLFTYFNLYKFLMFFY